MTIGIASSKESNPQEIILPTNDDWKENFFSLLCLANKIFSGKFNDISKVTDLSEKDKNTINYQALPFEIFLSTDSNGEIELKDFNELAKFFDDDNNRKCQITIKPKQNISNNNTDNVLTDDDINMNNNNNNNNSNSNNSFLKYFLITTSYNSGSSQRSFKWVPSFMTGNVDTGSSEMKSNVQRNPKSQQK